jgi:hypothetical protein
MTDAGSSGPPDGKTITEYETVEEAAEHPEVFAGKSIDRGRGATGCLANGRVLP